MTERERFEAWARKAPDLRDQDLYRSAYMASRYVSVDVQIAWEAWQAACPEGWQCAPVEPTDEMEEAALDAHMPFGDMKLAIQAAIVHAPKPEDT